MYVSQRLLDRIVAIIEREGMTKWLGCCICGSTPCACPVYMGDGITFRPESVEFYQPGQTFTFPCLLCDKIKALLKAKQGEEFYEEVRRLFDEPPAAATG